MSFKATRIVRVYDDGTKFIAKLDNNAEAAAKTEADAILLANRIISGAVEYMVPRGYTPPILRTQSS